MRVLDRDTGCLFVFQRKNHQLTMRQMTTRYINLIAQQYSASGYTAYSLRASFVIVPKLYGPTTPSS